MAFISSGYDPKEPMKNRITDIGPPIGAVITVTVPALSASRSGSSVG